MVITRVVCYPSFYTSGIISCCKGISIEYLRNSIRNIAHDGTRFVCAAIADCSPPAQFRMNDQNRGSIYTYN